MSRSFLANHKKTCSWETSGMRPATKSKRRFRLGLQSGVMEGNRENTDFLFFDEKKFRVCFSPRDFLRPKFEHKFLYTFLITEFPNKKSGELLLRLLHFFNNKKKNKRIFYFSSTTPLSHSPHSHTFLIIHFSAKKQNPKGDKYRTDKQHQQKA